MEEIQEPSDDQSCSQTRPLEPPSPSSDSPPTQPEMRIHEWEVWYTYATYLHVTKVDLDEAARSLVEAGIALCAMLWNGRTYWSSGQKVCSGKTTVELDEPDGTANFSVESDTGCTEGLDGFAQEAWYQAAYFQYAETRVFGEDQPLPSPYLRAFLGQCNLIHATDPESKIRLYPTLLIYGSGVTMLELRAIGPECSIPLRQFITDSVNLFQIAFERVEVPPSLANLATQAYYHSYREWSILYRAALVRLQQGHETAVRQLTRHHKEGDFGFDLAPMSSEEGASRSEVLSSFALTVFHSAAFAISRPRSGVAFLLRGQKRTPQLGNFWSGRPHIYIIRFDGQSKTASENECLHEAAFRSMLLRSPAPDAAVAKQRLPKDCRLFEDYNAYVTSAATLWVWSTSGIDRQREWVDANRGDLIYAPQAVVELLEYGCMLHHSLLDRAMNYSDLDEVYAARRALIQLRQDMRFASHSGEIMDLLKYGWDQLKVPQLREQIDDTLRLREDEKSTSEARATSRIGNLLTILFGLVAIPSFATQVVEPAWQWLNIPRPCDDVAFQLLANGVSFIEVVRCV